MSGARPFGKRLSRSREHLWRIAGAVSVRTKILGIILALLLLLGVAVAWQVRAIMHAVLMARLQEQSVANARDLAFQSAELLLLDDLFALHALLAEMQANNDDLAYAFVVDEHGVIVAHTFGEGFPAELRDANGVAPNAHHQTVQLATEAGPVWDTAVPILHGRAGVARLGVSDENVRASLSAVTNQLLMTILLVSAAGILAAVFLTSIVTRPLRQLKEAAEAVGAGDFSRQLQPWTRDEIGALTDTFNQMTHQLAGAEVERQKREELRRQLLKKVIGAQERERQRIARELHDEMGSFLTSLMMRLQMMSRQCPLPELKPEIEELRKLTAKTLENTHHLAVELRPSVLDDLGLAAALEHYTGNYGRLHALDVDLLVYGLDENRLPPPVETALYRIVQEGLTNVARHAQATTASVLVENRDGRVRTIIEDDGVGFSPESRPDGGQRLGLYGMQERAELLGGNLTVESKPGQGTTVFVEVPL